MLGTLWLRDKIEVQGVSLVIDRNELELKEAFIDNVIQLIDHCIGHGPADIESITICKTCGVCGSRNLLSQQSLPKLHVHIVDGDFIDSRLGAGVLDHNLDCIRVDSVEDLINTSISSLGTLITAIAALEAKRVSANPPGINRSADIICPKVQVVG